MNRLAHMTQDLSVDSIDLFQMNFGLHRLELKIGVYIHFFSLAIEVLDRETCIYAGLQVTVQGTLVQGGDDGTIVRIQCWEMRGTTIRVPTPADC